MKSTDMFLSAAFRNPPRMVFLNTKKNPEGAVYSPYVVSLWKDKTAPIVKKQSQAETLFQKPDDEKMDDAQLWRQIVSAQCEILPVSEQISRVEHAKKQYSQAFQSKTGGLFRRFW